MCALFLPCKLYRLKGLFAEEIIGRKLFRALKYVYFNIKRRTSRIKGDFKDENV